MQSVAEALGSVWSGQEGDQFLNLRAGFSDSVVSSSVIGNAIPMTPKVQSFTNNQRQDLFRSSKEPSFSVSSHVPTDRVWSEMFQNDAHHLSQFDQNMQQMEQAELLFRHLQQEQQQRQKHQVLPPGQLHMQPGAALHNQIANSGLGHSIDDILLQHPSILQPSLLPSHKHLVGPTLPQSAMGLDTISRLQLQHLQQQAHNPVQLQTQQQLLQQQHHTHAQIPHPHMFLQHQRQSHQTSSDHLLSHLYDPSYEQNHLHPSQSGLIDQLILRQEGLRPDSHLHQQSVLRPNISMERNLSLEQLFHRRRQESQSHQLSLASQRQYMDERRVSGVWAVDESGEFVQTQASNLQPFDLHQPHQRMLSSQQPNSHFPNFQSSHSLALNADTKSGYPFEQVDRHERSVDGRLHGMLEPNFLSFERPADLSLMNMDVAQSLKQQLKELRMQEQFYGVSLAGQDEQILSKNNLNSSRPLPMHFQALQPEATSRGWEQPSNAHASDVGFQGTGYFMQQGQALDFNIENQGHKLELGSANWQSKEGSKENHSLRSISNSHNVNIHRQLQDDSFLPQFSLHSGPTSLAPGNGLSTSPEQRQHILSEVDSIDISRPGFDSAYEISGQLSKNYTSEEVSEVLKELAIEGISPIPSQATFAPTSIGYMTQSKSLCKTHEERVGGQEALDGSNIAACKSSSEMQMCNATPVHGGYGQMSLDEFVKKNHFIHQMLMSWNCLCHTLNLLPNLHRMTMTFLSSKDQRNTKKGVLKLEGQTKQTQLLLQTLLRCQMYKTCQRGLQV